MARRNGIGTLDAALNHGRNNATQIVACIGEPTTAAEGIEPNVFAGSTAYALGAVVRPATRNTFAYEVTTAGTTAVAEPTWPVTPGTTVVSGTVTFTCRANRATAVLPMAPGNYTVANGLSGGNTPRRLTMAARPGATVFRAGSVDHAALMNPGTPTAPPELFWVTVATPRTYAVSDTLDFPGWTIEIGAAA